MSEINERILVIGPAWIGDMVMAQSLFITLRRFQPGAIIDVLAPAWSLPLLARMPEVNEAISLPVGHGQLRLVTRYRLGTRLRQKHYDQAIVLPRSFKSALVPFFARIPRRTGYRGEWRRGLINDMRPLDKRVLRQTVQRYTALGMGTEARLPPDEIPQPRLSVDGRNQVRRRDQLGIPSDRPLVGFLPGAEYGPAKRWPVNYYAALARMLKGRGYGVCLFGSARDAAVCAEIKKQAEEAVVDLSGKTALVDAIDLIAAMDFVVTNDSGLMHVAAAVGCPMVAIFGSSTPAYTPPLTDRVEIVYLDLDCSPCFERDCPLGHLNCLKQIEADDVFEACMRIIKGGLRENR
jgi:heptosyltransferase II